jgi:hypothetical protein
MIYLTYNDPPSGVFSSQVCDVCNYLNSSLDGKVRLVAIISIRSFFDSRKKIRNEVPDAIVIPALPKANYWKFSCVSFALICLFTGEKNVIARNVIAAKIALFARKTGLVKKVCLDGRGAIAAEWNEYEVVAHDNMKTSIASWERTAVIESDYRIAVSQKLVDWWQKDYNYHDDAHVVIPCTLQSTFPLCISDDQEINALRKTEGFSPDDIIMVYSGSTSGWQSFSVLETLLSKILTGSPLHKLVFLSKDDPTINQMKAKFPGQVFNTWLPHSKVQSFLSMCDVGIVYREQSITNQVASPTKFAEYLSAGLPVMISEGIGDYSDFVKTHDCGIVIKGTSLPVIEKTNHNKRAAMVKLAAEYFTKAACKNSYRKLLTAMN